MYHQNVPLKCLIKMSQQNFSSKCLIEMSFKMSHQNVSLPLFSVLSVLSERSEFSVISLVSVPVANVTTTDQTLFCY